MQPARPSGPGQAGEDIEDAVSDLKAVNPKKQAEGDTRTPAELLDIIEQKGREVAEAVAALRAMVLRDWSPPAP